LAISEAWQTALSRVNIQTTLVSQQQAEMALLKAMQRILLARCLQANASQKGFDE